MTVSLNILLDAISTMKYQSYISNQISFQRITLLPKDVRLLSPEYLYVCRLSEALKQSDTMPGKFFLCLRDRFSDALETPDRLNGMIIVSENIDLEQLFITVQEALLQVSEWSAKMKEAIITGDGLHALLELSEPIIGNFISISDSALKLIAYTEHITCDDPVSQALIQNGYHTDENVEVFRKWHRFEKWESESGFIIDQEGITSPYHVVSKVFKLRKLYFNHVVMICNNKPLSPALLDLFSILLDHLVLCIKENWAQNKIQLNIYDAFLIELIDGNTALSYANTKERAAFVGIPLEANFTLLKIVPDDKKLGPPDRFVDLLSRLLPDTKVLLYRGAFLLLIINEKKTNEPHITHYLDRLRPTMDAQHLNCGISTAFGQIIQLKDAYMEASLALDYGQQFKAAWHPGEENPTVTPRQPFFEFEDYYIFYLLCEPENNQKLFFKGKSFKMLQTLSDYDKQHKTDNMVLLYVYLCNERRSAETSKQMHMHRNNVMYRINRIQDIIGVNLDEYWVRMKLLLTYEALWLKHRPNDFPALSGNE